MPVKNREAVIALVVAHWSALRNARNGAPLTATNKRKHFVSLFVTYLFSN
jgi:hypothetical protein